MEEFRLLTLSGETYSISSLKGRPTLLMFWAPWCPICQKELPLLAQFYKNGKSAQLQVLAVGFADRKANVEAYVRSHPETFVFPTAYDEENRTAEAFGVNATPTFVLMDVQGGILLVHRGGGINQNRRYREFLATLKN